MLNRLTRAVDQLETQEHGTADVAGSRRNSELVLRTTIMFGQPLTITLGSDTLIIDWWFLAGGFLVG